MQRTVPCLHAACGHSRGEGGPCVLLYLCAPVRLRRTRLHKSKACATLLPSHYSSNDSTHYPCSVYSLNTHSLLCYRVDMQRSRRVGRHRSHRRRRRRRCRRSATHRGRVVLRPPQAAARGLRPLPAAEEQAANNTEHLSAWSVGRTSGSAKSLRRARDSQRGHWSPYEPCTESTVHRL